MAGLARTPASAVSLLLNAGGVFITAIAWYVFGEGYDRRIAFGFAAITLGVGVLACAD
jgi:drug/metabolite transporter (DMT)-like permease